MLVDSSRLPVPQPYTSLVPLARLPKRVMPTPDWPMKPRLARMWRCARTSKLAQLEPDATRVGRRP